MSVLRGLSLWACLLSACSLMELDELSVAPCQSDLDCYALSATADGGPRACYRCDEQGVCRARAMQDKSLRLHDGPLAAGAHGLTLDTAALPSGFYLVRATSEGYRAR